MREGPKGLGQFPRLSGLGEVVVHPSVCKEDLYRAHSRQAKSSSYKGNWGRGVRKTCDTSDSLKWTVQNPKKT